MQQVTTTTQGGQNDDDVQLFFELIQVLLEKPEYVGEARNPKQSAPSPI